METMERTSKQNSTKVRVQFARFCRSFKLFLLFSSEIPIYNSASIKLISFDLLVTSTHTINEETPVKRALGLPTQIFTKCKYYGFFLIFWLQIVPSIIVDGILKLLGKKPM